MVVHVLTAVRPDARVPTDGEARLAAAVFAVRDGRVGPVALPFPDALAARQLAGVAALLPAAPSVWESVRVAGLALGVVTALLLWALLRRLGCGSLPTALAVAVVGVPAPALFLHASATGAAVGVPWLLLAAVLSWRGRVPGILAVAAAAVAVLTAPLLGAVLLALAAHAVADRVVSRTLRAARGVPLAAALGAAAVGVAVASADSGPLAGAAAPVVGTPAALAGAVCGLAAVVAGWWVRWVRPLLTPAVLILAVLVVPGPARAAAALTALALLAVVAAAVADDAPSRFRARLAARVPARATPALWVAAAVALVALAVAALPAGRPRPAAEPAPATLMAWAGEQDDPHARLHADALDRAELVAAGFPVERLRGLDEPAGDVDVVLLTARAQAGTPAHCAPGTLLETLPGWGGAPAEICGARPAEVADDPAERASRARIGAALSGNPELRLGPAAAELLRRGDVDPRVMIVLVALTGSHTVEVADFPAAALAPPTTLRRQVLVRAVDGAAATADAPSPMRAWLDGQLPPYAPTVLRDDGDCLLVGYRDAAPPGLLPT